jgi:hypothetical protein
MEGHMDDSDRTKIPKVLMVELNDEALDEARANIAQLQDELVELSSRSDAYTKELEQLEELILGHQRLEGWVETEQRDPYSLRPYIIDLIEETAKLRRSVSRGKP